MLLHELHDGQQARIIKISMPIVQQRRLFYLGIYKNTILMRIQAAPFHDPVIYWVNATQLVMRNKDAACIEVEVM